VSAISTSHPSSGVALLPAAPSLVLSVRGGFARWAVLSLGLAIVLGAGWWVTNSPVFDLRSLQVRGNVHLTTSEVAGLSGLTRNTNVLWFGTAEVERRLESDPWILDARVSRALPSGITIMLEERVPIAMTSGRHPMLLAGDGMVLGPAGAEVRLPVVGTTGRLAPGDRVSASDSLAVVRSLPPDFLSEVATVGRQRHGPLVLALRDGVQALYGDATAAGSKSQTLRAVLAWAARHGVRPGSVDVRAPTAPALHPYLNAQPSSPTASAQPGG
jgi:cell division protein FtsQ